MIRSLVPSPGTEVIKLIVNPYVRKVSVLPMSSLAAILEQKVRRQLLGDQQQHSARGTNSSVKACDAHHSHKAMSTEGANQVRRAMQKHNSNGSRPLPRLGCRQPQWTASGPVSGSEDAREQITMRVQSVGAEKVDTTLFAL